VRQRLIELIWGRVQRFGVDHDPATVLGPEAVAELTALLKTVPDPTADLEVAQVAGWLHWCRYVVLDPGDDQQDLLGALALFEPVYRTYPHMVPPEVHAYFSRLTVSRDPLEVADRGTTLLGEAERTGDRVALTSAIDLLQQAVASCPADHPDRAAMLSNLGGALRTRFASTGDQADLDTAITAGQQALAAAPAGYPHRVAIMSTLSGALQIRFASTGERADLDMAVDLLQQAVVATPVGHPDRARRLSDLGILLQIPFASTGERADLGMAVDLLQQAVVATPVGHPDRARRLSDLGIALRTRFVSSGDRADLDASITAGQQAVAASRADHPDRAGMLSTLSVALDTRFSWTGDQADLDAAVDLLQQAVAATPVGHPGRAGMLSNLGIALQGRFSRTGDLADLDASITAGEQAVTASPDNHPDRAGRLSNLSGALRDRFASTGALADLDAAIVHLQQVVAASPADHHHRAGWLSNLSVALWDRFSRTGDQADLRAVVDLLQQAVAATSDDHPDRAQRLSNLGVALRARFASTGDQADLDAAIALHQQAVAVEAASPRVRAIAAREWGRTGGSGRRWQEAVAGFEVAAGLLGLVAPRSLARGDQEHLLGELGGLGADAAACCVHAGLRDRAVELFEQGRGVLLGQALETRTDLTVLAELYPGLAARFTALRDDLDQASAPSPPTAPSARVGETDTDARVGAGRRSTERRRAAVMAFDQIIAEIRGLPAFGGFLRPPPVSELLAAATQGPVVVVTVSEFGSHALILAGNGVLAPVPLHGLTPETVRDRVAAFLGVVDYPWSVADGTGGPMAEQRLGDTLGWLWEELAGPVLDRLGISGPPRNDQPWPRLWWCVSGLLSFLPVHAAGRHSTWADAAPATVIDRVISSYTPTIRALTYARRPGPATVGDGSDQPGAGDRVVAVAMPHTPGAPDLPGAQAESTMLQRRLPGRVTVLTGEQATHDAVLAALPDGRWAHLACHGDSDLNNPSASCLLLTDHRQRPLTVADVARLRLDDARLAFLSACSTAQPGRRLADEAIHLASAFQLAGYRHVIATLWPIGDQHAVDLAADIYTALITVGDGDVAGAVHAAVRRMRRRWGWDTPSVWASHIHVGA
jgi:hypothetical protein